jgi:phosphoribosylglycinamide formyltransferase-1
MRAMKRIVILISGRGTNMQAIVRAAREEQWPAKILAVISNKPDAEGLRFASRQGIPTIVVPSGDYATRDAFDAVLQREVDAHQPDLVVLAGFMRILTTGFVDHYAGRMINIHPSLLPAFPGLATHRQALQAGVDRHGATVHFVTPKLDHGPIIAQASVPVLPGDTEEILAARVLVQEHRLYPNAVRLFVEDRLTIDQGVVRINEKSAASVSPFKETQ